MKLERLISPDRRILYLLIALGTAIPILVRIGFPVSATPPVEAVFDAIAQFDADDVVLLSFDYGPNVAPECSPMGEAILRHCFERRIPVILIAFFPVGGITMAGEVIERVLSEYPAVRPGEDYVFLGYKDGAQAAMKQMGVAFANVFPVDNDRRPLAELPLMQRVTNYSDISLVVTLTTNVIGDWWINLVNAQFKVPIAIGATAVSAPKFYAFLDSGQAIGMLGGLKGASEYEHLLVAAYPHLRPLYERPGFYTAMKGMDAQTVDHALIMLFIVLGNLFYLLAKRRKARPSAV